MNKKFPIFPLTGAVVGAIVAVDKLIAHQMTDAVIWAVITVLFAGMVVKNRKGKD